jgi:hypothetical protein
MQKLARFKWAILLVVIGIVLNVVAVISVLNIFRDKGTFFFAPGEAVVNITKPGSYTLWQETRTVIDGKFMTFSEEFPSGTIIKVVKQPEGTDVALRRNAMATMEANGTRRVSIADLTFSSPGAYRVVVTGLSEKRALYLEEEKIWPIFLIVIVGGLLGMLFLFSGIGAAIFVFVRMPTRVAP